MLQWMGGARRKVTTSRKSTQKRQKQYFEQRKRQQQHQEAALNEDNVDGLVTCVNQTRNRSLDILSLLNVSEVTKECKPFCGIESGPNMTNKAISGNSVEEMDSSLMRKAEGHAFPTSYHTSTSTPNKLIDEFTETRVQSLHQAGRVSAKRGYTSYGKNKDSEYFKSASSMQPSIFDIIGDDGAIGSSEEPLQEAHVAFSIEGLGKVGTETPMQSPRHPGSILNGEKSSFTKAAKNLNFNTMKDELEIEMECLMEEVEKPSCRSRVPGDVLCPFSNAEDALSAFKVGMHFDGKKCKMNSRYGEDRPDNFWNASSSCLDDYQVDEKCGVNWKSSDANLNSFIWRNDSTDFKFGRCHTPLRCQNKMPDINTDGDFQFASFDKPKYSSFVSNYHPQDHFSPSVYLIPPEFTSSSSSAD